MSAFRFILCTNKIKFCDVYYMTRITSEL